MAHTQASSAQEVKGDMTATSDKAVAKARAKQYMKALRSGAIRKPSQKTLDKHRIVRIENTYIFREELQEDGDGFLSQEGYRDLMRAVFDGVSAERVAHP